MISARPLPRTTATVSPITLGASWLGTQDSPGEVAALADAMVEAPFAVDTSNNYQDGASETALGAALARREGLRPGHPVFTKVDRDPETGAFDRDRVWRSFEESSRRLGLDRFSLLHLHDPYSITLEEAMAPGGAIQGMVELREQGITEAIGIAVGELSTEWGYVRTGVFDAVLTHNRYTLVDRRAQALIEEASEAGMAVFNAAPYGGGLLAGKGTTYAYREAPPELLDWVKQLEALCDERDVPLPAAALHFSMRHPGIHSTVVGIGKPRRVVDLLGYLDAPIDDDFWDEIDRLGAPPSTIDD